MTKYLKLFRISHYLKNSLIFLPLFFSGNLLNYEISIKVLIGFIIFCLLSSCVYIFNDIIDVEKDRKHFKKKFRPIASNKISVLQAKIILCITFITIIIIYLLLYYFKVYNFKDFILPILISVLYIAMNLLYSKFIKNIPIVDVIMLSSMFILRVIYGGSIINVNVSSWLYLTVLSLSLFMALGKRKSELAVNGTKSRQVLKYYTAEFLNKYMYVFLTSSIIFYSLWCTIGFSIIEKKTYLIYSIIFFIFIIMKYSLHLEQKNCGDPIEIIYHDKILLIATIIYILYMGVIIYV